MSKFCENCGSELVEGNKFCSSCGADVSNQSSSNVNNVINSSEKEKVRKLITQLSQKKSDKCNYMGCIGCGTNYNCYVYNYILWICNRNMDFSGWNIECIFGI